MKYTDFTEDAISMRLEGYECLSWVERTGYDIIMRNLHKADPETCNYVIVMRVDRNILSVYYCYFFTDSDAQSKFMVIRHTEGMDNKGVSQLMENAQWDSDATQCWWNEVFHGGVMKNVDESILKNESVKVTEGLTLNMEDFLLQLEEKVVCETDGLKMRKYDPVFHVYLGGDYAEVLPFKYIVGRIYGCDVTSIGKTAGKAFFNKELKYKDVAQTFYIPWKLREMQMNISPTMTLNQVAATSGISVPIPVAVKDKNSKEIESVLLAEKPVVGYENLSWGDLIANDDCADLQLDDYFFKDLMLSVVPDGYGTYYIGNVNGCKHRITLNRKHYG